jgi:hypothetical protein
MVFRDIDNWNRNYSAIENFYPGDIFYTHYRFESGGYTQVNIRSHNKIVSRQIYPDSIAYTLDEFSVNSTQYNNATYWVNGVPFKTESRLLRDTQFMPEEYIPLNSPVFYTHTYLKNTDKNFCSDSTLVVNQERQGRGLFTDDVDRFQPEIIHYKSGLGVVYSYKKGGNQQFYSYDLLAYKRGGITCGVLPNSISVVSGSASFKLFPQPAGNTVFLEASNLRYPALIRIQNMQGQFLSTQQITAAGKPISTANLPAGLYLLSVSDASGNSALQKLIVESE